jgi:hypothetical protein
MKAHRLPTAVLVLLAACLFAVPVQALTWTCSTVVRKNAADPLLGQFTNKFNEPAINGAGDVAFHAKVKNGGRRLYIYPGAGAPVIVATEDDPAPGGSNFQKFESPSINDAGDLGFFGDLADGAAVFVRDPGGMIVRAAGIGDASPAGGTFAVIVAVSRVNDDGDIAFVAQGSGGPDGVFLFDSSGPSVSTIAVVGGLTGDGREFCDLVDDGAVALSDSGDAVFRAATAADCAMDPQVVGLWQEGFLFYTNVADEGDATPIPGTSYQQLFGVPLANASDEVLFRAKLRPADTCNNLTANLCTVDGDCAGTCLGGSNVGEACALLTDCPDQGMGTSCTPGVCGGTRCTGGAQIGKPCAQASDCGGSECGVPGQKGKGLFLFDPSGPSTAKVAVEGDAAPNTGGGFLKTLAPPGGLSDAGQAAFRSKVNKGNTAQGVFVFNGTDEDVVLRSDAVPNDVFGAGTAYRTINEETGFDRSGTQVTFSAKVKDTNSPPSNAGLFRCEGT